MGVMMLLNRKSWEFHTILDIFILNCAIVFDAPFTLMYLFGGRIEFK